ncbi:hypothetical protein MTP99_014367 [Tenebrio molitor]|jgi:hypothetical protein|nr:hypothetical protein MTP99_014367 [Tenebrio molitor]
MEEPERIEALDTLDTDTPETESCAEKKVWPHSQTLELIYAVESHYDDLDHPQKRKQVWENISNDLGSKSIIVSSNECYKKWQNLLRTYKTTKDNKKKRLVGSQLDSNSFNTWTSFLAISQTTAAPIPLMCSESMNMVEP